jgi:hypothetical protein
MCDVRVLVYSKARRCPILFRRLSPESLPVAVLIIRNTKNLRTAKMRIKIEGNEMIRREQSARQQRHINATDDSA